MRKNFSGHYRYLVICAIVTVLSPALPASGLAEANSFSEDDRRSTPHKGYSESRLENMAWGGPSYGYHPKSGQLTYEYNPNRMPRDLGRVTSYSCLECGWRFNNDGYNFDVSAVANIHNDTCEEWVRRLRSAQQRSGDPRDAVKGAHEAAEKDQSNGSSQDPQSYKDE